MKYCYTDERNAQIVISLMKAHNIRKVIASPGTTNICLIASMQQDPYFEIYSAPEERSAGYMACGLAAESGEPVAISCTGATASRNYMPALTEAYYRKLPILAITSSRRSTQIGHNFDQVTDRTQLPRDVARLSVQLPVITDVESEWGCIIAANKAMLELRHHGGGPVHINLETAYSRNYGVEELPPARAIYRISHGDQFPKVEGKKIGILVGTHAVWSDGLTKKVEDFCEIYNAVVICDHTSNYKGKYKVSGNLMGIQRYNESIIKSLDLMIYLGDILALPYAISPQNVWRVNPDGELRDPFRKLRYVFEMTEDAFFEFYTSGEKKKEVCSFYRACEQENKILRENLEYIIKKLPFSNAWIAAQTTPRLPANSAIHFGIQNSLRFWNFFQLPETIHGYSNTGGFGIDGPMSTTIGAALADGNKIFFCVLGDLAFFYDLNSLGNRHLGNNVRIILVNNGKGTEFKLSGNPGSMFGEDTDRYIAAGGHYGRKSKTLVKHYAEDLGMEYLSASSKEMYLHELEKLVNPEIGNHPMLLEVFTNSIDEDAALTMLQECLVDEKLRTRRIAGSTVKSVLGEKGFQSIKKILIKG